MSTKNTGKKYQPKLSLKPIRFDEAMKALLQTKPVKKEKPKQKPREPD
jgi:hypothetical protein